MANLVLKHLDEELPNQLCEQVKILFIGLLAPPVLFQYQIKSFTVVFFITIIEWNEYENSNKSIQYWKLMRL